MWSNKNVYSIQLNPLTFAQVPKVLYWKTKIISFATFYGYQMCQTIKIKEIHEKVRYLLWCKQSHRRTLHSRRTISRHPCHNSLLVNAIVNVSHKSILDFQCQLSIVCGPVERSKKDFRLNKTFNKFLCKIKFI